MNRSSHRVWWLPVAVITAVACNPSTPPPPVAPSGDAAFGEVAHAYLEDVYRRQPTFATFLGIHKSTRWAS